MISQNGAAPKLLTLRCNPDETGLHFRERILSVEYNTDGIPVVLHIRCKNRECCPRIEGLMNVHLFTIWGKQNGKPPGQYVTVQVPFRDASTMPVGVRTAVGSVLRD